MSRQATYFNGYDGILSALSSNGTGPIGYYDYYKQAVLSVGFFSTALSAQWTSVPDSRIYQYNHNSTSANAVRLFLSSTLQFSTTGFTFGARYAAPTVTSNAANLITIGVNPGNASGCILFDNFHRLKLGLGAAYFGASVMNFAWNSTLSQGPFRTVMMTYLSDGTLTAYDYTGASVKQWTGLSIPDVASPYIAITEEVVQLQDLVAFNRVLTASEISYLYFNMANNNVDSAFLALSLGISQLSNIVYSSLSTRNISIVSDAYVGRNAIIAGTLSVGGAVAANGGFTCDSSAFTVADVTGNTGISGTLSVGGNTQVGNLSSISNIWVSGTTSLSGAVTLSSTLSVGGAATITGQLNANGGIVCDTNKFLVADNTGHTTIAGNLSVGGTLSVVGATTLSSTLSIIGNTQAGHLSVISNLSVAGTTTLVGATGVTGTLSTGNTLFVTGATTLSSTLSVVGNTQVGHLSVISNLNVAGTATVTGTLSVGGAFAANGGFTCDSSAFTVADVTGNTGIAGTLSVGGNTRVGNISSISNIWVSGTTALSGAVTLSSTLSVGGNTQVGNISSISNIWVSGTTALSGAVTLSSTLSVGGTTTLVGATTVTGQLTANGGIVCDTNKFIVADTTGHTTIAGNLSVGGTLSVVGATTLSSTLSVIGNTTVGHLSSISNVTIAGTLSVISNVTVQGNLYISQAFNPTNINTTGTLSVAGDVNFQGYPAYGVRAWVRFSGTGTILNSSPNISAITRLDQGNYRCTFNPFLPTSSYAVTGTASSSTVNTNGNGGPIVCPYVFTISSFDFEVSDQTNNSGIDPTNTSLMILF
jgi:hypothetical protein